MTASLFYNPNSPPDHVTWPDIFVVSENTKPLLYSKKLRPAISDRPQWKQFPVYYFYYLNQINRLFNKSKRRNFT